MKKKVFSIFYHTFVLGSRSISLDVLCPEHDNTAGEFKKTTACNNAFARAEAHIFEK